MDEKNLASAAAAQAAQVQAMLAQQNSPNLAKAFVAAWGQIPAVVEKDANNSHFGNDYATLEAVQKLVKPILRDNKLAFIQSPGAINGDKIEVVAVLVHESGERWTFKMEMPLGGKLTAQAGGSATTYARRYQMLAIFGIAPSDDDGEAASAAPPKAAKAKAAKKDDGKTYAEEKQTLIDAINAYEGTADGLSTEFKAQVEAMADAEVNEAYVAKRRSYKGGKKGN